VKYNAPQHYHLQNHVADVIMTLTHGVVR